MKLFLNVVHYLIELLPRDRNEVGAGIYYAICTFWLLENAFAFSILIVFFELLSIIREAGKPNCPPFVINYG
jgi:hypothetical protein